jgi:hypothetical protein
MGVPEIDAKLAELGVTVDETAKKPTKAKALAAAGFLPDGV